MTRSLNPVQIQVLSALAKAPVGLPGAALQIDLGKENPLSTLVKAKLIQKIGRRAFVGSTYAITEAGRAVVARVQ